MVTARVKHLQYFNPTALGKAEIVYTILAFLSAVGLKFEERNLSFQSSPSLRGQILQFKIAPIKEGKFFS